MTADDATPVRSPDALLEELQGLESADATQAAAVAVAIGAHLRDRELIAATAADGADGWTGRKWEFADRLDRRRDRGVRIPTRAPSDPWTAAARADRL